MTRRPTPMQWRCLVAYHRHHGNVKVAAHALGISQWMFGFHLRALCLRLGLEDRTDASLAFAAEIRRELGQVPDQPGLGLE